MLICPRCEKSMESHVDGQCQKPLSRRFFLGALGTAFGTAALAKVLPNVEHVGVDLASGPDETVVQVFRPRIHQGGTITMEFSSGSGEFFPKREIFWGFNKEQLIKDVQELSRRESRPVVAKWNGQVVHYADPTKKES